MKTPEEIIDGYTDKEGTPTWLWGKDPILKMLKEYGAQCCTQGSRGYEG